MTKKRAKLILSSIVLSLLLAMQAWAAVKVEIESPKQDAAVEYETLVRGKVSDPSERVYVLVHPLRAKYWWVQRPPSPAGQDGRWQTLCYFGEKTKGAGEFYEVVALATSTKLREGQTLEELPRGAHSEIVTVRRAQ